MPEPAARSPRRHPSPPPPVSRQPCRLAAQRGSLVALQEVCLGGCCPLGGDRCDLLAGAARTAEGRRRSADIRAWAKDHGIAVSDRGRIPASVLERYQTAAKRRRTRPIHSRPSAARSCRTATRVATSAAISLGSGPSVSSPAGSSALHRRRRHVAQAFTHHPAHVDLRVIAALDPPPIRP